MDEALKARLQEIVDSGEIVLFMKGNKHFPRCGFSATVVEALKMVGAQDRATYVDILKDPEVRAGMKIFSQWPTFPQLYFKGELIGGCDIVRELAENGELQKLLGESA